MSPVRNVTYVSGRSRRTILRSWLILETARSPAFVRRKVGPRDQALGYRRYREGGRGCRSSLITEPQDQTWLAQIGTRAEAVRQAAPFRRVQVETLREDWPEKRAASEGCIRAFVEHATREGGVAIVIPYRVQGLVRMPRCSKACLTSQMDVLCCRAHRSSIGCDAKRRSCGRARSAHPSAPAKSI